MKKRILLPALAAAAWVGGCSGVQVSQDYNLVADLAALRTYAWQSAAPEKSDDVRLDNPLLHARIRDAVERALSERGYRKVDPGTADFRVSYHFAIRRKIESDDVRTGVSFGFGRYGRFGGIGVSTGDTVSEYDEGLLVIDFIDAHNGELVWRGTGTRRLSQHSTPEKITQNVNETVDKILDQFPPQPKS